MTTVTRYLQIISTDCTTFHYILQAFSSFSAIFYVESEAK